MTTHYLLLSDSLVPPALDGRKTQTRRIVAWSNSYVDGAISQYWRKNWHLFDFSRAWLDPGPSPAGNPGPYLHVPFLGDGGDTVHRIYPRYQVGDRLIFKECWFEEFDPVTVRPFDPPRYRYRATEPDEVMLLDDYGGATVNKDGTFTSPWKSSMFMPVKAARSINRITCVRAQRVQEITEEDAKAEGVEPEFEIDAASFIQKKNIDFDKISTYLFGFKHTYDRLNAKRGFPWSGNHWVWPVTFTRETEREK